MARQVRGLISLGISLDVILTSPLVRAVETAEVVRQGLCASGQPVTSEALAPTGQPAALLEQIVTDYSSAGRVMVVGHEPYLSGLISVLATGDPAPVIRLKKGSLCKLRVPSPRYGRCGWIEWSLTPRQMVKLG